MLLVTSVLLNDQREFKMKKLILMMALGITSPLLQAITADDLNFFKWNLDNQAFKIQQSILLTGNDKMLMSSVISLLSVEITSMRFSSKDSAMEIQNMLKDFLKLLSASDDKMNENLLTSLKFQSDLYTELSDATKNGLSPEKKTELLDRIYAEGMRLAKNTSPSGRLIEVANAVESFIKKMDRLDTTGFTTRDIERITEDSKKILQYAQKRFTREDREYSEAKEFLNSLSSRLRSTN